jgi:hypothetical protein
VNGLAMVQMNIIADRAGSGNDLTRNTHRTAEHQLRKTKEEVFERVQWVLSEKNNGFSSPYH